MRIANCLASRTRNLVLSLSKKYPVGMLNFPCRGVGLKPMTHLLSPFILHGRVKRSLAAFPANGLRSGDSQGVTWPTVSATSKKSCTTVFHRAPRGLEINFIQDCLKTRQQNVTRLGM